MKRHFSSVSNTSSMLENYMQCINSSRKTDQLEDTRKMRNSRSSSMCAERMVSEAPVEVQEVEMPECVDIITAHGRTWADFKSMARSVSVQSQKRDRDHVRSTDIRSVKSRIQNLKLEDNALFHKFADYNTPSSA